jgi:Ca2+-binding RTX toxin-like protein
MSTLGDDRVEIAGTVPIDAMLVGGDGNDQSIGGGGYDILVGNKADDKLQSGKQGDLLIGGLGADTLRGQGDQDILIGGRTDYDHDLAALNAILVE